jgi:hypothetical protein
LRLGKGADWVHPLASCSLAPRQQSDASSVVTRH